MATPDEFAPEGEFVVVVQSSCQQAVGPALCATGCLSATVAHKKSSFLSLAVGVSTSNGEHHRLR